MKKAAFTLIELLVVIAIIAILAGLAVPALIGALEKGKATKDANNLHQLGIGMVQYLNQNDDTMFPTGGTTSWPTLLQQFVPDPHAFLSPFDSRTYSGTAPFPVSYGFNQSLYGISTSQFTYPSALIVLGCAPPYNGMSTGNVNITFGIPKGEFRNGSQLNVLYSDAHVSPILLTTFNDTSSDLGKRQWVYDAQ